MKDEYVKLEEEYIKLMKMKEQFKDVKDYMLGGMLFPYDFILSSDYDLKIKMLKYAIENNTLLLEVPGIDSFMEKCDGIEL